MTGNEIERDWKNEQYELADFDREFGMLAYTLAEVQGASRPATTAVQNFIAGKVVERFRSRYDSYVKFYNPNDPYNIARAYGDRANVPMTYDQFYNRNRGAYLDVLSQPIDLSFAAQARQPNGGATPGELFPSAFAATTVGDAMNWLTRTELPGILTSLAKPIYGEPPYQKGADGKPVLDEYGRKIPTGDPTPLLARQASNLPADELNAAWMRGYETIHLYNPGSSNNFTVWFNAQAKKGIEIFWDAEKAWRSGSTPLSFLTGSGDESGDDYDPGGGHAIDMNSGEWGDGGNSAVDMVGGIGNASRFSLSSQKPGSGIWGVDWNAPGGKRRAMSDYVQDLIYKFTGKDKAWDTMNVQTGRLGTASGANNLQVFGVDPASPAGIAGMKEGAFVQSLQRLFQDPRLPDIVDELYNGSPLQLPVIQPNEQGELVEQILNIQPGSMAGRGLADNQDEKVHWIEALAGKVDPDYGRTVSTLRGTWRRDTNGQFVYQSLDPAVNRTQSTSGIPTNLFTTDERFASGMYQDANGNWKLSPMKVGMDNEHTVPVTITAQAMKQFAPLYDQFGEKWREYEQVYNMKWSQAHETQLERYLKAKRQGVDLKQPFLDAVREMTLKLLPRDIPQPGTKLYQFWQAGAGMLEEIRDFEQTVTSAPSSGDFYGRTIEQWDAWASSMERYKNSGVYGYLHPKRLAQARAEVSGAGNYLESQRQQKAQGLLDRIQNRNSNPGGYDALHKLLVPNENGELVRRYPEMTGISPGPLNRRELEGLVGWRETARKRLAGSLAHFTPAPRSKELPDENNGTFTPGADPSYRSSVLFGVGEYEAATLSADGVSGHLYPRSEGRIARRLAASAEQARAGAPAPDFQGNPASGQVNVNRVRSKYQEPETKLPPYQDTLPFPEEMNGMEEAAYAQISNRNATSVFPQGSMNEDDFPWQHPAARNREDAPAREESTYDNAVLGGDASTDEYLNALPNQHTEPGYGPAVAPDPYVSGVSWNRITHESILPERQLQTVEWAQGLSRADLNCVGNEIRPTREDRQDGDPAPLVDSLSVQEANRRNMNSDPIIARRMQNSADRDEDREMEGVSDEIAQDESERRFQQAWRVLDDPNGPYASPSAVVSSAGNALGFLKGSKVNWRSLFDNLKRKENNNESNATYHALKNADTQADEMGRELVANISALEGVGMKRAVMLTRLGERDQQGRSPELAQEMAKKTRAGAPQSKYYRETLQQINREYKLNLSWQPGREAELYDQLADLKNSNPEAYSRVSSIFASPGEQLKLSRQYLSLATTVPGNIRSASGPTPPPQRVQEPGDSHVFRGPDGKGRAMLKYSPNQEYEMRRGRGQTSLARSSSIDPVTGEFDPYALENTPVSAQLAARGGGGNGRPAWTRPDYEELTNLQNSITYKHFESRRGDDQRGRLGGQVQTYIDEYIDRRKRFDLIMPYNVDADQDGAGLRAMLGDADAAVRGAFGSGFDIGQMEELSDPDLPEGFVRMGATVRREGEGPEYVNDFAHDADPGEPPEAPPMDTTPPAGSNGAGGNGNPPPGTTTATPDPTPQPARSNGNGRAPKPQPNTNPASFPMTPGKEGWRMTFTRYDPSTRKGKSVTAWARKDADGNLGWYELNAENQLEPLRVNKGWGRIYDETGTLTHEVNRNAREYFDAMNAPISTPGDGVSSAGNGGTGVPRTPAPTRSVIRTPEEWAAFTPQPGMMLVDRRQGYNKYNFAIEDPENPGQMKWVTSAREGGIQEDATNPGWGQIMDPEGNVVADVPQHKYEIYANQQGLERSAENKRLREEARAASQARLAELRQQREVATSTPPPQRTGFNAAFGRFNNAMWGIAGRFQSRFLQSHSPTEFGETEIGENTKLAMQNEYLAQATHLYNSYIDSPPASADQIMEDIIDLTGAGEEQARPIADALYQDQQDAKRRRSPLKKENPMRRSMERAARLNEAYDNQDVGRGPLGFRTHAANKVQDVGINEISNFHSPSLGEANFYPYSDEKGEQRIVPRIGIERTNPATGEKGFQTTANETQIAKGLSWAQNAFNSAFSGDLPSSPEAIIATVKERMWSETSRQMKADIENATKHGQNQTDAGIAANVTKEITDHFATKIVKKLREALGVTEGEANAGLVAEGTRYDTRIKSVDQLKAKIASDPVFAAEFKGRSAEDIHGGDEMVVFDQNDRSIKVGGGGRDAYGTRVSGAGNSGGNERLSGAQGFFGKGTAGSLMYGAYLLKREWQMAAGATMAAAEKYGEGMADYSGLLYSGSPMGGTDMGFTYRQEVGEAYMGKAAYSAFGAFMEIPYRLSETGNLGAARMLQTAGIAGGVAMGGAITGGMLTASGMAAAGGALAAGGLWVGGALLAGVGAMELYNAFNPEDAPDLTLSTIVSEAEKEAARNNARTKRKEALYGNQEVPSGAEMSAFMLAGGSQPHSPTGQSAAWAARSEMNKYDQNKFVTDEELMEYMTPEEKQLWVDEEMNKKAEELVGQVREIRGRTLEDKNTLIKGLSAQKWYMGSPDPQMLGQVSEASALIGVGSDQSITEGASYAQQLGFLQGTPDFTRAMYQYALTGDRTQRQQMQYTAARVNQFGSQIQSLMGTDGRFAGMGSRIAQTYNFQNQSQVGAYTSMIQGLQQQGADLAPWRFDQLANLSQQSNPFVSSVIGNAMESYMAAGGSAGSAIDFGFALSSAGISAQDASVYGRMMQGDLHAYSYQAWQSGNMDNAFFDKAGRSITQYYGTTAMQVYNAWAPKLGKGTMTSAQFLGTNNQAILNAWEAPDGNGGFYGLQKLANQRSYAASMASIGIQLKGIALSENFYWGANQGGTWNNPSAHSAWGIENQMLDLQHASTLAGFDDQWTRMNLQNRYSIRREDNQFQRMTTSQNYQNWQMEFSRNQSIQSQQWAQADWLYQDTMRGMSFGWQMEDLNEGIRFASGRERKQLIKQRDRAALTHNIEDEQIDTTRDRQKEVWAQQEEQYQKQREYNLELQRLDQESFALNKQQREDFFKLDVQSFDRRKKEYEEEKKLQDVLRELQRKFQYDQLQLQKEAAGAQAAAAAAQKEINDAILEGQKNWESLTGEIEQMNNYNNAYRIANATNEMFRMMDNVSTYRIDKLIQLIRAIGVANPDQRVGGERE